MAGRWLGSPRQQQNYISANYTHAGRYILERGVNVLAQLVAPPECAGGGYSLSCNPDITPDFLAARRAGQSDIVFAGQVNGALPFMDGQAEVLKRKNSISCLRATNSAFRCSRRRASP